MDDATLEQYADWLDEMERTDPEGYKNLMMAMKAEVEGAAAHAAGSNSHPSNAMAGAAAGGDNASSLFDMLKKNTGKEAEFKPRFPGEKVMESTGLKEKQEGMYIDVKPGFVMKTTDLNNKKKVFVNVCYSDKIQTFSQKKKLDDEGNEQEGIHVPLSLGAPHEVTDKKGVSSLAFDVAVNTQVVEDCKNDKSGAFRNFVCELAIEYIDQKYKIQLDARFKLPRLAYRGELPPPRHYIRKTTAPIIEEVSTQQVAQAKALARKQAPKPQKTALARVEVLEERHGQRVTCLRVPASEPSGTALSPEILTRAGTSLVVQVHFDATAPIAQVDDVEVELGAELLTVKAAGHQDVLVFLPYPVVIDSADAVLDVSANAMTFQMPIDKSWHPDQADCGSAPWLLAQALTEADNDQATQTAGGSEKPKSLEEMFHLAKATEPTKPTGQTKSASPSDLFRAQQQMAQWDPVHEDEELPEDKFHRKDMLSMHILEQRRRDREQKAKEADEKRAKRRQEVEEMRRKAEEAGKTWSEMYPNEPETTYVDLEEFVAKKPSDFVAQSEDALADTTEPNPIVTSEDASKAAATWLETRKRGEFDLDSALAFELL